MSSSLLCTIRTPWRRSPADQNGNHRTRTNKPTKVALTESFTDHVNHAFQFSVTILQRFVRLIDSWASRLAIERRTQQDLCPARRSPFSLSLYTEPESAVALFIDHAHQVARKTAFRKLGSLATRRGDVGRSERLALGIRRPRAGTNCSCAER